MPVCRLERAIVSLKGNDVTNFLNGLITNSLDNNLTFAALLTPQGKIIADFFVHRIADNHLVLETPEKFVKALAMRLKMYKLRAKIDIEDISNSYSVYTLWDGKGEEELTDPRLPALGQRWLSQDNIETTHTSQDYDLHRLKLGVPDSQWDFDSEQIFPADANMDLLHGVDYKKGCFIGQEVVSRMHRKTTVRKRMRTVKLSGTASPGNPLKADGRTVGTLNHVRNDMAMALIRLDRLVDVTDDVTTNDNMVEILEPTYGHKAQ